MTGTILTIAQQKGGSGKTTVTAHLALGLLHSAPGLRIALLDVDPQGSLGTWVETREARLGETAIGVTLRTASGWGARREARALARDHDFVLIDTPPKTDVDARPAIDASDLVIVPVQPTLVDLWATGQTFEMARREDKPAVLVLNRVPPRAALTGDVGEAIVASGFARLEPFLGNRTVFAASMGQGLTALETEPRGKAAAEVLALVAALRQRLPSAS
ncbi:ParA family partition ATPase [Pannonibacter sp. SL95]|uniref:ParA family partition ATPase n=1 Tax=Pannonibacter sp. SL95 TaxID=2995153 RepID=UPI002276AF71|nr:ParA family partition ATPase [Pannonibacter sp. SL95]MCY1708894.1 ParA family protein [Pannonibacter sp. SL95]